MKTESGSAAKTLEKYKPDVFAKGGDRTIDNLPQDEIETCKRLGIKLITGVGGEKIQSSSWLVDEVSKNKTDGSTLIAERKTMQKLRCGQRIQ